MIERRWKYFKLKEFECKCGCGFNNINYELVDKLDEIRESIRTPIIITSGTRCKKHNKQVGGIYNSPHLRGLAVDIAIKKPKYRHGIIMNAILEGINRIGIAKEFIHLDVDKTAKGRRVWLY